MILRQASYFKMMNAKKESLLGKFPWRRAVGTTLGNQTPLATNIATPECTSLVGRREQTQNQMLRLQPPRLCGR